MKRGLLILLMLLLPLHTTWASVACVRNLIEVPASTLGVEAIGAPAVEKVSSAPSIEKYDQSCCPGCHTFCHFAATTPSYSLSLLFPFSPSLASAMPDATTYQSHIPDGPTRPKWPAAS